ncbi:MAG: protein BatD [Asgard group archaeon]|nr:protein BatD [Asgard group archaeon]
MKKRRTFTLLILLTIFLVSAIHNSGITNTIAATDPGIETPVLFANDIQVEVTKGMLNKTSDYSDYLISFIGDTIEVQIEITNTAIQNLTDVSLVSPEWNLTSLGYSEDDFTLAGDYNKTWSLVNATSIVSASYTITPLALGEFTFPASNVTFTYLNGTPSFSLSNPITFRVLEEDEKLRIEKFIHVTTEDGGSGENEIDARIKSEHNFTVVIKVRNFYHQEVNITAIDNEPYNSSSFVYNTTHMEANTSYLGIDQTFEFSYEVHTLENGTYYFPNCTISFILKDESQSGTLYTNEVSLEVYDPIYEGPDWTLRVPLLTVAKYFLIPNENGTLEKRIKIEQLNTEIETVIIEINITNTGVVEAQEIYITELVYNDWVFQTVGVENWYNSSLSQGESIIIRYNITARLLGSYKIEPTEIKYDFVNQETLLIESDYYIFSNTLEITIRTDTPIIKKSVEWWITIGMSFGILLLAVIPTVITFVIYRNRRRTQKGT